MANLNSPVLRGGRFSLIALWGATAIASILELHGRSAALLRETAVPVHWHDTLIVCGALLDAAIGLALWRWHRRAVYRLAAANLVIMTAVATLLLPSLWLDPLGSLTKNLPIAALLWILHQDADT